MTHKKETNQPDYWDEEAASLLEQKFSVASTQPQSSNLSKNNKIENESSKLEKESQKNTFLRTLFKWGLILAGLYLGWTFVKSQFSSFLMDQIQYYSKEDPWLATSFFVFINTIFSWFPLPGLTYFDIAIASLVKDFNYCFLVFFLTTFLAGVVCFVFVKYFIRERMLRIYGDSLMYKVFREEVKKNPWAISWMVNCLLIPSCFKNILLPLTEMTFW